MGQISANDKICIKKPEKEMCGVREISA